MSAESAGLFIVAIPIENLEASGFVLVEALIEDEEQNEQPECPQCGDTENQESQFDSRGDDEEGFVCHNCGTNYYLNGNEIFRAHLSPASLNLRLANRLSQHNCS